jgi:hypothetical protein
VYEVLPSGETQGVLFLAVGMDLDDVLLVEARLVMIRHPVRVIGATTTAAFMEFRLLDTQAVAGRQSSIVKDIVPGPGVTCGAVPTFQRIQCYAFPSSTPPQPSRAAAHPLRIESLS